MKFKDMLERNIKVTVTNVSERKRKEILVTRKLEEYYSSTLKEEQHIGYYRVPFLEENNLKYSFKDNNSMIRFGSSVGYDRLLYVDYQQALDFLLKLDLDY